MSKQGQNLKKCKQLRIIQCKRPGNYKNLVKTLKEARNKYVRNYKKELENKNKSFKNPM